MRIYFDPPDSIGFMEKEFNELMDLAKTKPGFDRIIPPLMELVSELFSEKAINHRELTKYKIMWALRFLDPEIEKENGSFRIQNDDNLRLEGFSDELMDRIKEAIKIGFKK